VIMAPLDNFLDLSFLEHELYVNAVQRDNDWCSEDATLLNSLASFTVNELASEFYPPSADKIDETSLLVGLVAYW
jgi:hypothetical protein